MWPPVSSNDRRLFWGCNDCNDDDDDDDDEEDHDDVDGDDDYDDGDNDDNEDDDLLITEYIDTFTKRTIHRFTCFEYLVHIIPNINTCSVKYITMWVFIWNKYTSKDIDESPIWKSIFKAFKLRDCKITNILEEIKFLLFCHNNPV